MSTRARGQMSRTMIDEGYPHQVEAPVREPFGSPERGERLTALTNWITSRGLRITRPPCAAEDRVRYGFADPDVAEVFAAEFDGRVYEVAPRRRRAR